MNRGVFLSLLALDAYNRGYGQGVFVQNGDNPVGQAETGRRIGQARVTTQSTVLGGSEAREAGLYAIAYDWNGETVISYRGTNFPNNILEATVAEFNAFVAHASARTTTAPC